MGGKRKVVYFQPKPKRTPVRNAQADPAQALATMEPLQLAQGINNLIKALEKKGVQIMDYDQKERKLYSIQQVKGKFYFLAAEPEQPEGGGD